MQNKVIRDGLNHSFALENTPKQPSGIHWIQTETKLKPSL